MTVTFRLTRDELIQQALLKVGAIDPENSAGPSTAQINNAALSLNMMVKGWQVMGLHLWERKYGVIFPQAGQGVYSLGNPGPSGDHSTLVSNLLTVGDFLKTKLNAARTSIDALITVDSISSTSTPGIPVFTAANTQSVGILLDSGVLQWTTINGVPVGSVIPLFNNVGGNAAVGNTVYVYPTKLMRPLRILNAFYRQPEANDIPIRIISRDEYSKFGFKPSQGTSIQMYYDPQVNVGFVNVYPVPADSKGLIFIEFQKPIDDFVVAGDPFDLPQEWAEAIVWNLALREIPNYRTPETTANRIERMANRFLEDAKYWDQEQASIYFQPDNWVYQAHSHGH